MRSPNEIVEEMNLTNGNDKDYNKNMVELMAHIVLNLQTMVNNSSNIESHCSSISNNLYEMKNEVNYLRNNKNVSDAINLLSSKFTVPTIELINQPVVKRSQFLTPAGIAFFAGLLKKIKKLLTIKIKISHD